MPTAYPETRTQRNYVQVQTLFDEINNLTNAATVAATDAFLCVSCDMAAGVKRTDRPDKTGVLGKVSSTPGRFNPATWAMRCSLAGSGAPGTAPDIGPFLEAAMNKAGVPVTSTSVTYGRGETNPGICLTIWDFNSLASAAQRCVAGAIPKTMKISFGDDYAYLDMSGVAKAYLDSAIFSGLSAEGKMDLTAFPTEPGTRTIAGTSVAGYKGTITLGGQTYTTLESGELNVVFARSLWEKQWGSDYPGAETEDAVDVKTTFTLRDDDSSNLNAFKLKSDYGSQTSVALLYLIGTIAGNKFLITLGTCSLPGPTYGYNGQYRTVTFTDVPCFISSASAVDDVIITCT